MESDTSMITPPPNKSAQTFKRQIKCMIVWLIILSVFLAAMLAGQIVTVAYKQNANCEKSSREVGERSLSRADYGADLIRFITATERIVNASIAEKCNAVDRKAIARTSELEQHVAATYSPFHWTAITMDILSIETNSPRAVRTISLSEVNIPEEANEVLVLIIVASGNAGPRDVEGFVEVYSDDSMKQFVYMKAYDQEAWSYNSENLWVAVGDDRTIRGRFIPSSQEFTGNHYALIKIIGYR